MNTVANLLVTMGANSRLNLQTGPSAEVLEIYGGYELCRKTSVPSDTRKCVNLGSLQFGQSRSIVLRMKFTGAAASEPYLSVSGQFQIAKKSWHGLSVFSMEAWLPNTTAQFLPQPERIDSIEQNFWRLSFVTALSSAMELTNSGQRQSAQDGMTVLKVGIEASPAAASEILVALLEDVTGQTGEALSRDDWWRKWGKHFLPSLRGAHLAQQCNNFKDPGVQVYGGSLFETIRDQADDVFNDLPPPKPTARPTPAAFSSGVRAVAPPVSMAAYNDRYGG